jgi:WD40 repeat protein
MESMILDNTSIQKQYQQYLIKLSSDLDLINILIEKDNRIYESNFNLEYLHQHQLLTSLTTQEIIEFIVGLIDMNKIEIKEENINLKLILISTSSNHSNVELNLQNKSIISNEIENRIDKLERFHCIKDKIELKSCNLKNITSIHCHNDCISSVSTFPSGNIISTSNDKSIIIYDILFNILQNIPNAHDKWINYVEIKDENNFITCSGDKSIKSWNKNNNEFKINKIIKNAHDDAIIKVIYCSNNNLISCSYDETIKIWKENNNYENIKILKHSDYIYSLLLLEDKNILISSGRDGTKLWNYNEINNINLIKEFKETFCGWNQGLCRLNHDIIVVGGNTKYSLKLISISKKEIIKTIHNPFQSWGISLIEHKGIFLVGGISKDIRIYRNDNYECIQEIKDAHNDDINGFIELKDGSIASFSSDETIKKWSF